MILFGNSAACVLPVPITSSDDMFRTDSDKVFLVVVGANLVPQPKRVV